MLICVSIDMNWKNLDAKTNAKFFSKGPEQLMCVAITFLLHMCARVCSGRHPKSTLSLQWFSLAARSVPTRCTHLFTHTHNQFLGNYIWLLTFEKQDSRAPMLPTSWTKCECAANLTGGCVVLSQQSRTVTFDAWTEGRVQKTAASARKATLEITADNVRKKKKSLQIVEHLNVFLFVFFKFPLTQIIILYWSIGTHDFDYVGFNYQNLKDLMAYCPTVNTVDILLVFFLLPLIVCINFFTGRFHY